MVSFLVKVQFFLFFLFSTHCLFSSEKKSVSDEPRVTSYWEFQNSALYYNFFSKEEGELISHIGLRTGLSYVKVFSFFSLSLDFFLLLGPYTELKRKNQEIPLNFLGFGGRVGLIRELDFVPWMRNIALASGFRLDEMKSYFVEEKSLEFEKSTHLLKVGELRDYSLKIRSLSLDLLLVYYFSESFQKMLAKNQETKKYGHSISIGVSLPFYSSWKKRHKEVLSSSSYQDRATSSRGEGFSLALSYQLAFM